MITQALIFPIGEGLGRRHGDRITGVHPHRIEVFDAAHNHDVVGQIAHHLQLEFLPAEQRLLNQDLGDGAGIQAAFADGGILLRVVGDAATAATEGEGRADDARKAADGGTHGVRLLQAGGNARGANLHADALHRLFEQQAVFRFLNRLQIGADQLDAVALQRAVLRQSDGEIEGGLAPHGGQQGVGALLFDHPGHHLGGERLHVGAIGHVRIGHDRGGVGIHQHHLESVGAERFAGLSSGVIKLAGLSDHNRAGSQEQNATQIRPPWHGPLGIGKPVKPPTRMHR